MYDAIKNYADDISGEIMDINDGVNDYYETIPEAVADMLDVKNITGEQAAAVKNAAAAYWYNKINFNEYAAELLTALTPHEWNCRTLRGYCQGDWINILYPADVYGDAAISEYECYFFGMYCEYNARYNGDNVTYYYSDNYTRDEIISYIAADFNASPDQIVFNSCY